jgi:hypothetical protein
MSTVSPLFLRDKRKGTNERGQTGKHHVFDLMEYGNDGMVEERRDEKNRF